MSFPVSCARRSVKLGGLAVGLSALLASSIVTAQVAAPPTEEEFMAQVEAERQKAEGSLPRTHEERIARARSILDENLVDYSGARLRDMHLVDTGNTVAICGYVNAPNRMGGMSGWQQTAIILKGRYYAPFHQVGTDGYTGLAEYAEFCPKEAETADAELTAELLPEAVPAAATG